MILDDLAAAVVTLDADDLPALGRLRTLLEQLTGGVEGVGPDVPALARRASQLVESLMLREAADPAATLAELGRLVVAMQQASPEPGEMGRDPTTPEMASDPVSVDRTAGAHSAGTPFGPADAPAIDLSPSTGPRATPATSPAGSEPGANSPTAGPAAPSAANDLASDPALMAEFVNESLDHVTAAEAALLTLEAEPGNLDAINAVFRAFHTIKGTSGFLNLIDIQHLAHRAETLLDRARAGEVQLVGGYADLSLESADWLRRMIEAAAAHRELVAPLDRPAVDSLLARLAKPEDSGISASAGELSPVPRVGDLLVATGRADRTQVEQAEQNKGARPIGQAIAETGAASASDVAAALRTQKRLDASAHAGESADTIRVSTNRLDSLVNLVGELVITQAMIHEGSQSAGTRQAGDDQGFLRTVGQMSKITRELQDLSMSLRMVPLKPTFQKMARLVRDLARKSGKTIQFSTDGEDTEIDRGMVESLADPLIHLVRNAVDHGIEPADARTAAGKPIAGTVLLRAYHAAGSVIIELRDDGRGLDRDRIRAKAIAKGLLAADANPTDSEIHELIFAPGFSTAERVTDVSGRGVGMDVVRRNIEALRGRIDITTTPGAGTTFALRVPLTLAIIDGMVVRVGSERYVLPTVNIQQAFRPEAGAVRTVTGRGEMVQFRDRLLPVFRLASLFAAGGNENQTDDTGLLVVVEDGSRPCALAVSELLGQQQVVIKSLGSGLGMETVRGVSGAAILGDGRVGLILDVQGVVALACGVAGRSAA